MVLGLPREALKVAERVKKQVAGKKIYDRELFNVLRATRKQIADEAGVPPFVVFSDATLVEMACLLPRDERQLRQISGVGDHKLKLYGRGFLEAIAEYPADVSA